MIKKTNNMELNKEEKSRKSGEEVNKKEETEPSSPLSAPENKDEIKGKKTIPFKMKSNISMPMNLSSQSEQYIIKTDVFHQKVEENKKNAEIFIKSLPQYDFLLSDKLVYKL